MDSPGRFFSREERSLSSFTCTAVSRLSLQLSRGSSQTLMPWCCLTFFFYHSGGRRLLTYPSGKARRGSDLSTFPPGVVIGSPFESWDVPRGPPFSSPPFSPLDFPSPEKSKNRAFFPHLFMRGLRRCDLSFDTVQVGLILWA